MILTEDSKIRPIEDFTPVEISNWCRDYVRYNKYPTNLLERFAIGVYQINQGLDWRNEPLNRAESYMSACLHFLMVGEMLNLPILINIELERTPLNYERVLDLISKVQQQIFYHHKSTVKSTDGKVYVRASRFNRDKTAKYLQELVEKFSAAVPREYSGQGLFHASRIMSGVL